MPDVSVVMAVRDGARELARTVDSVLGQTGVDLELIVVDDGSTDATPQLLHAFAGRDSRIRVIRNDINVGLTRSLITGCEAANGRYIARQDCGDCSLPGRLARQVNLLDASPELAFVSCWTRYCDGDGRLLYESHGTGRAAQPINVIDLSQRWGTLDGPTHHGAVMFRSDVYKSVGGYRAAFYYGQDWDLWYRLAERGRFQMVPEVLYEAMLSPGDLSLRNRRRQLSIARWSRKALELRSQGLSDEDAVAAAARVPRRATPWERALTRGSGHYFIGECLRRNGDRAAARTQFAKAVQQNPINPKFWIRLAQAAFA